MRKAVLISIFVTLTIFVIAILIKVFFYANNVDAAIEPLKLEQTEEQATPLVGSKWAEELANVKKREFAAPVNDLYISSKLIKVILESDRVYQLYIDKVDRYSLFCIDRVLITQRVRYSLTKDSKQLKLYVVSKNRQKLQNIIKELKKYDINSKIKEVTKI